MSPGQRYLRSQQALAICPPGVIDWCSPWVSLHSVVVAQKLSLCQISQCLSLRCVPGWWLSIFSLLPPAAGLSHTDCPKAEKCCEKLNYLLHSALTGPHRPSRSDGCLQHLPAWSINTMVVGYSGTSLGFRVLGICKVVQCNGPPSSEVRHAKPH